MDLRQEILETIKMLPQWKDISAPSVEQQEHIFRKNAMRCYEINTDVARALNKNSDIEALLVGAHYGDTPSCSNYYVLARNRKTGEKLLVDAVINSEFDGMHEPFIGSLDEAKYLMHAHPGLEWKSLWNLYPSQIVVHEPAVPLEKRNATRMRWGEEIGKGLAFDVPHKTTSMNSADGSQVSFGELLTLGKMNAWALRIGLHLTHVGMSDKGRE